MEFEFWLALAGVAILAMAIVLWRRRSQRDARETIAPAAAPAAATPEPTPARAKPPDTAAREIASPPKVTAAREALTPTAEKPKSDPPPFSPAPEAVVSEVTARAETPETPPQHKPKPPALREKARRKALKKFREWTASDDWCVVAVACADRSDRGEIDAIAILDHEGKLLLERRLRGRAPTAQDGEAPRWPELHEEVSDILAGFRRVLAYDASLDARMFEQTCARYGLDAPNTRWEGVMQAYAAFRGMWNMTTQGFQCHSLDAAAQGEGLPVRNGEGRTNSDERATEGHDSAALQPAEEGRQVIALLRAVAAAGDEQISDAAKGARS